MCQQFLVFLVLVLKAVIKAATCLCRVNVFLASSVTVFVELVNAVSRLYFK